jgi:hypothetical protein
MNSDITNNIMKLAGVLNSADVKALIPQISALANQKAQQEQNVQQGSQQQKPVQQQAPQMAQQPQVQAPAPSPVVPAPAPVQASVDTSGRYGAMRKVKRNIAENYDDASDISGYNRRFSRSINASKIIQSNTPNGSYGKEDNTFSKEKKEEDKKNSIENIKKLREKEKKNREIEVKSKYR